MQKKSRTSTSKTLPSTERNIDDIYDSVHEGLNASYIPKHIPSLLQVQSENLLQILYRSITSKENSSVLIIGPTGSGKSLLISHAFDRCLPVVCKNFKYQVIYVRGEFLTTEQSCHTQLKCQFELPSYTIDGNKDAMSDSDSEEEGDEDEDAIVSKNLLYLEERLIENKKKGICTIFVIDRFEQACLKAKRTLYHIANASHLSTSNMVIVGLTTCQDIESQIDKRTLSRLLSRRIFTHLPRNVEEIKGVLSSRLPLLFETYENLPINRDSMEVDMNIQDLEGNQAINAIEAQLSSSFMKCLAEPSVREVLQRSLASSGSVSFYLKWLSLVVNAVQRADNDRFTPDMFTSTYHSLTRNPMLNTIQDLNIYELCMLVACKKCEEYGSKSSTNFISYSFEIAYSEYCKFVTGGASTTHVSDADLFRDKLMSSLSVNKSVALTKLQLGLVKLAGASKKLLDSKGKKRDISTLAIRLNGIHPVEIDKFLKEHKQQLNSEIYRWAVD